MDYGLFGNLYLVLLAYAVGFVGVLGLAGLLIFVIVEYFKNKKIKFIPLKLIISVLLLVGVVLSLPYYLATVAFHQNTFENDVKYLKYAANTAVIPSVKADVYYLLRAIYQINHKGKDAIEAYETAVKLAGHESNAEKSLICFVYFAKPDREKILQTCSPNTIAVDYVRTKEYDKALEIVNNSIKEAEANKKMGAVCAGYSIRAGIYKQSGDKAAYKKDYDKVIKECSYYKFAKTYAEADNILDVYIKDKNEYEF